MWNMQLYKAWLNYRQETKKIFDQRMNEQLWIWHSVQDFDTFPPFLLAPKGIRVLSAAAQGAHIFFFPLNIKEVEDQTKNAAVQSPSIKIKTELEKVGQMCGAVADYGTICFESRTNTDERSEESYGNSSTLHFWSVKPVKLCFMCVLKQKKLHSQMI